MVQPVLSVIWHEKKTSEKYYLLNIITKKIVPSNIFLYCGIPIQNPLRSLRDRRLYSGNEIAEDAKDAKFLGGKGFNCESTTPTQASGYVVLIRWLQSALIPFVTTQASGY